MKTLCLMMSGQPIPNLLTVHQLKPDRLVLVESMIMRNAAVVANFLAALKLSGLNYDHNTDRVELENEAFPENTTRALAAAFAKYPDASWTVNLCGGNKPMAIAAHDFFKAIGGTQLYIDVSNPGVMLDFTNGKSYDCWHRLGLVEFCAAYGYPVQKSSTAREEAHQRAEKWWDASRLLALYCDGRGLFTTQRIDDNQRRRGRSRGYKLEPGDCRELPRDTAAIVAEALGCACTDGMPTGRVDRYAFRFLSGEWLEVFFWGLLSKNAEALGIWDVCLGIDPAANDLPPGNEFDVSFMRKYELNMIECKTGTMEGINPGDILYKVDSVIRAFRALRFRSFWATSSETALDRHGSIRDSLMKRAANNNCIIIARPAIHALAEKHKNVDCIREILGWTNR